MRQKLVIQAERWPFILDMLWPVAILLAVLTLVVSLLLPPVLVVIFCGSFLLGLLVFALFAVIRSKAEYSFLPASEYRGVRLNLQMGRTVIELADVHTEDFIFGASWVEKLMGVSHIKIRNTTYKMRGIREMDEAKAWIAANIRSEEDRRQKKGKGAKKK